MINRPPTRIELKLEDDLVDYEETTSARKNQINKKHNNLNLNESNIIIHSLNNSSSTMKMEADGYNNNQLYKYENMNSSSNNIYNNFSSGHNNYSAEHTPPNIVMRNHSGNNITKQNIISEFISEECGDFQDRQDEE